jgi:hypothetical protein
MAKNRSKNSRGSNRPGEGLRFGGFGFTDGRNRQVEASFGCGKTKNVEKVCCIPSPKQVSE